MPNIVDIDLSNAYKIAIENNVNKIINETDKKLEKNKSNKNLKRNSIKLISEPLNDEKYIDIIKRPLHYQKQSNGINNN